MQRDANARVAAGDPRRQQQVLGKRKERVVKSARSLAKQCGVPVAVFSPRVGGGGDKDAPPVLCWPSKQDVGAIATPYNVLPKKDRTRQSVHAAPRIEDLQAAAAAAKTAKLAKGGGLLGDMPEDELRVLLRSLDESVAAASDRIRPKPRPQTVEEIDQELMFEYADKFMVDSQDDVVVDDSTSQDMAIIVAKESSKVQLQPPDVVAGAGAEEAELSNDLVQSITEKPKPYTPPPARDRNGVSYYEEGRIEYVNLGGYMTMERDAFDFIQHDLGMPPPSLEPELPDDDDYDYDYDWYGQLWSWTSLPLPIPPPP